MLGGRSAAASLAAGVLLMCVGAGSAHAIVIPVKDKEITFTATDSEEAPSVTFEMTDAPSAGPADAPADAQSDTPADALFDAQGSPGGDPALLQEQPDAGNEVGGEPATVTGAAENEANVASPAPTPPNGAESAVAWSPVAADVLPGAGMLPADATSVTPGSAAQPRPGLAATNPRPRAQGLSSDSTRSGALFAILAFAVLLFLVAHQLVDRRDPRVRLAPSLDEVTIFR